MKKIFQYVLFGALISACNNADADKYKDRATLKNLPNQIVYIASEVKNLKINDRDTSNFMPGVADSLAKPLMLSTIIDTVNARVINLGKKGSVFGSMDKILFTDSSLFIFDWKVSHDIFQFDSKGNFIKNFRYFKKTLGLTNPVDFDVCGDTIYIVDQSAKLWMINNRADTPIAIIKLPFIAQGVKSLGNTQVLLYNGSPEYNENILLRLSLRDTSLTGYFLPIQQNFLSFDVNQYPFGNGSFHSTLFMPTHNDTVYRISNNSVSPAYCINFGKKGIPAALYKNEKKYKENYLKYRRRFNFYTYETDKYFTTTIADRFTLWAVLDKMKNNVSLYKSVGDNLLGGAIDKFPIGQKADSLVFLVKREALNNFFSHRKKSLPLNNLLRQLLIFAENKSNHNNPILIVSPWR